MTTSSAFKIEHDKAIPSGVGRKYPWNDMQVGDSFFVPDIKGSGLLSAATRWSSRRQPTWRFATRAEGTGIRIWRIEDKPDTNKFSRRAA